MLPERLSPRIRVAIIGCGRIAGGRLSPLFCDLHTYLSEMISLDIFDVCFICDPDPNALYRFTRVWADIEVFTCQDRFFSRMSAEVFVDLIIISSPSHLHISHLQKAREAGVRHIIIEKPITLLSKDWNNCVASLNDPELFLWINFTRSWNYFYTDLRNSLSQNKLGRFVSGKINYSQGVLNCLIHVIDLLHLVFGDLEIIKIDGQQKVENGDSLMNFMLTTTKYGGEIEVYYVEGIDESLLEMELSFERCDIRLANNLTAIEIDVEDDLDQLASEVCKSFGWATQFRKFLLCVAKTINGAVDSSDVRDRAIMTEQFCHDLIDLGISEGGGNRK